MSGVEYKQSGTATRTRELVSSGGDGSLPASKTRQGRQFAAEAMRLKSLPADRRYLRDVFDLYSLWLEQASGLSPATVIAYRSDLGQFVAAIEGYAVDAIDKVDRLLIESWKTGLGLPARATVRRKLSTISAFFKWAIDLGLAAANPVQGIKRPRKLLSPVKHVSLEHFELLLGACENAQERAILGVLYWGGLRRQEAVDLNVADVDLDRNLLWVHGKGGDEREVCIFPKLRPLLAEH
jgi:site-specific recombinase XerD